MFSKQVIAFTVAILVLMATGTETVDNDIDDSMDVLIHNTTCMVSDDPLICYSFIDPDILDISCYKNSTRVAYETTGYTNSTWSDIDFKAVICLVAEVAFGWVETKRNNRTGGLIELDIYDNEWNWTDYHVFFRLSTIQHDPFIDHMHTLLGNVSIRYINEVRWFFQVFDWIQFQGNDHQLENNTIVHDVNDTDLCSADGVPKCHSDESATGLEFDCVKEIGTLCNLDKLGDTNTTWFEADLDSISCRVSELVYRWFKHKRQRYNEGFINIIVWDNNWKITTHQWLIHELSLQLDSIIGTMDSILTNIPSENIYKVRVHSEVTNISMSLNIIDNDRINTTTYKVSNHVIVVRESGDDCQDDFQGCSGSEGSDYLFLSCYHGATNDITDDTLTEAGLESRKCWIKNEARRWLKNNSHHWFMGEFTIGTKRDRETGIINRVFDDKCTMFDHIVKVIDELVNSIPVNNIKKLTLDLKSSNLTHHADWQQFYCAGCQGDSFAECSVAEYSDQFIFKCFSINKNEPCEPWTKKDVCAIRCWAVKRMHPWIQSKNGNDFEGRVKVIVWHKDGSRVDSKVRNFNNEFSGEKHAINLMGSLLNKPSLEKVDSIEMRLKINSSQVEVFNRETDTDVSVTAQNNSQNDKMSNCDVYKGSITFDSSCYTTQPRGFWDNAVVHKTWTNLELDARKCWVVTQAFEWLEMKGNRNTKRTMQIVVRDTNGTRRDSGIIKFNRIDLGRNLSQQLFGNLLSNMSAETVSVIKLHLETDHHGNDTEAIKTCIQGNIMNRTSCPIKMYEDCDIHERQNTFKFRCWADITVWNRFTRLQKLSYKVWTIDNMTDRVCWGVQRLYWWLQLKKKTFVTGIVQSGADKKYENVWFTNTESFGDEDAAVVNTVHSLDNLLSKISVRNLASFGFYIHLRSLVAEQEWPN